MLKNNSKLATISQQLAFGSVILVVISLTTSRALLSIGTFTLAISALLTVLSTGFQVDKKTWILAGSLILYFLYTTLCFFWSDSTESWAHEVEIKILFVVIPLSLVLLPQFTFKQWEYIILAFIATQAIVVSATLLQYALGYGHKINEGGPIVAKIIITGINHIYFGTILGFASIAGMYWGAINKKASQSVRWNIIFALGILCAIGLHFLNSRTGMLSFYAGAGALILGYMIRKRKYKLGFSAIAFIILLPIIFYNASSVLKIRVDNAFTEMASYSETRKAGNFENQPAGIRLLAWEAALSIISQHPILGTGIGDVRDDLMAWYDKINIQTRKKILLPSVHNQFLETQAGLGIIGSLILLLILTYPLFFPYRKPGSILLPAFLACAATAMLTESILERQIGISFFCIFVILLYKQT